MFFGGDPDQSVEVAGVLGDVLDQHSLAARATVPAVVERIGHQPVLAEPRSDVVVAAGVFAEPVREDDHPTRRDVRGPDVVDDAHAADAVEGSFVTGGCHQGQRRPRVSQPVRKLARVSVLAKDFADDDDADFSADRRALPA